LTQGMRDSPESAMAISLDAAGQPIQEHDRIWTKRERLVFPCNSPGGCKYSVPFFLHASEASSFALTDQAGYFLKYCDDQVYQAFEHRLLWISPPQLNRGAVENVNEASPADHATAYLYSDEIVDGVSSPLVMPPSQPSHPEDVLFFADYFRGSQGEPHPAWERIERAGEDPEFTADYVSVGPMAESAVGEELVNDGAGTDPNVTRKPFGQALRLDPGIGRVALRHTHGRLCGAPGSLHVRAHFYDNMKGACPGHWMGLTSRYGSALVGLGSDSARHYAFINGSWRDGAVGGPPIKWHETDVARTLGWHLFEIVFEGECLSIIVDGESKSHIAVEGKHTEETIWLIAKRGGVGQWAGVEMIHTPLRAGIWDMCVRDMVPGNRSPWEVKATEQGRWQVRTNSDGQRIMVRAADALAGTPQQPPLQTPGREKLSQIPSEDKPAPAQWSLNIECWSLPVPETELARIERVMGVFLDHLLTAGVIMPDNLQRIGRCGARNDPQPCYIYRFGTRRLHINLREVEGGRLCLVVRCGGGFFDFAEFARRNGSGEQLKLLRLQRRPTSQGREVMQVASVLSKRERHVHAIGSSSFSSGTRLSISKT